MKPKKVHFIFAGGAAVSAVAALAEKNGFEVSACEHLNPDSPFFGELLKLKIPTFKECSKEHLQDVEMLVVSNATKKIDPENSEVEEAERLKLPVKIAEEFLAEFLLQDKKVVAVAGTNGKSTTTAMLGLILEKARLDPSVFVGAVVPDWQSNYRAGKGEIFVIEADEYSEKFLLYRPQVEIITNIEFDHPDYFTSLEAVQSAFEDFAAQVASDGALFLGPKVELRNQKEKQKTFVKENFNLRVPGQFNQENASLAFAAALYLGVGSEIAKQALEVFDGISRRFEFRGEAKGIKVFDDYAHHPSGVAVTLKAAREKFPNEKIWCVFQPHTFSRLEKLFPQFVEAFEKAPVDNIVLLPVYASRERAGKFVSDDLARAIKNKEVVSTGSKEQAAVYLAKNVDFGSVILNLGAGDSNELSELILKKVGNKA
ncbi:MAG: cyanophycin synthetase [bacterium]|nr:cyanophycin synthetase [bacterium]